MPSSPLRLDVRGEPDFSRAAVKRMKSLDASFASNMLLQRPQKIPSMFASSLIAKYWRRVSMTLFDESGNKGTYYVPIVLISADTVSHSQRTSAKTLEFRCITVSGKESIDMCETMYSDGVSELAVTDNQFEADSALVAWNAERGNVSITIDAYVRHAIVFAVARQRGCAYVTFVDMSTRKETLSSGSSYNVPVPTVPLDWNSTPERRAAVGTTSRHQMPKFGKRGVYTSASPAIFFDCMYIVKTPAGKLVPYFPLDPKKRAVLQRMGPRPAEPDSRGSWSFSLDALYNNSAKHSGRANWQMATASRELHTLLSVWVSHDIGSGSTVVGASGTPLYGAVVQGSMPGARRLRALYADTTSNPYGWTPADAKRAHAQFATDFESTTIASSPQTNLQITIKGYGDSEDDDESFVAPTRLVRPKRAAAFSSTVM